MPSRQPLKMKEHFWYYMDGIVSNFRQQLDKGIHLLRIHIITLITNDTFTHHKTKETLTIMLLQHTFWNHNVQDWFHQQDQQQLTYQALLSHCKLLRSRCEQYQKVKEKGCADLTTLTAVSSTASSTHQDTLTIQRKWTRCGDTIS